MASPELPTPSPELPTPSPELPTPSPELPAFNVIEVYETEPRKLEYGDFGEPLKGKIFCEECKHNGVGEQGGIPKLPGFSGPIEQLIALCTLHYRQSGGEHKPGITVFRIMDEQGVIEKQDVTAKQDVTEEQDEEIISIPPSQPQSPTQSTPKLHEQM